MSRWKSFGFVASTSASICGASSAESQANQDALELLRALSCFIARPWRGSTCRKVAPYGSSSSRLSTASPHLARPINELWDAPLCPSGAILVDALEDLVPKDSMGPLATKQALKRTRRGHESCSNGGLGPHFQALESAKKRLTRRNFSCITMEPNARPSSWFTRPKPFCARFKARS